MNYELLKKISNNLYINFESLRNNIEKKDLNINGIFRMTAEELLKQINNIHNFIPDGEKFYKRIIENPQFYSHMINKYNFDRKVMSCLGEIQKEGNGVLHNSEKIFDVQNVKERYYRLLLVAQKILQIEYKNNQFILSKSEIMNEIDKLLQDEADIGTKEEQIIKNIEKYNNELYNLFQKSKENPKQGLEEFIYKYKDFVSQIINYIIKNNKLKTLEDLKIGNYAELYKIYYSIDNLLQYEELDEITSSIYDMSLVIKNILINKLNINILNWIDSILVLETDKTEEINKDYLEIAKAIDEVSNQEEITNNIENTVYYIEKQKSFTVNGNKYYSVEIKKAINDHRDTTLVYSKTRLKENYAIELSLTSKNIKLLDNTISKYIVTAHRVAIRPCEINNLIYAITGEKPVNSIAKNSKFYQTLINYLEINQCTLLDIATSSEEIFKEFDDTFKSISTTTCIMFLESIKHARKIILEDKYESGANILRYILSNLNNSVLKKQINENYNIDNLALSKRCLPFDRNPFSYNLIKHKTSIKKLKQCFNVNDYADDLYVRKINDEMEEKQTLFIPYNIEEKEKIKTLIDTYNKHLHNDPGICLIDGYLYKYKNVEQMLNIISILRKKSYTNPDNLYKEKMQQFLSNIELDSKEKVNILKTAFDNSKICLIYGEAGSGKTEVLCNYFSNIFKDSKKLYIANTHACKNNMKRRVEEKCGSNNNLFLTINKANKIGELKTDILIIDECKSISNQNIELLLNKVDFKYAIFAGDIGQLDAIELGNWYELIKEFVNPNSVYELKTNFRSNSTELRTLWTKVRNHDKDTWNYMIKNNYIEPINSNIFKEDSDDQIILCLNYDGIYGIKSINSYFQNKNENKEYINNIYTYKEGDPVVFNENANEKYNEYLYNNLTGKIRFIQEDTHKLYFTIRVDTYISKEDLDCVITSNQKENWSLVKIELNKYNDNSEDISESDEDNYKCPFTVAYAASIHKSQGLQFESVKIIITPESETKLNNELFYTAITRSTKKLKIYLTETKQQEIVDIVSSKDSRIDSILLKELIKNKPNI